MYCIGGKCPAIIFDDADFTVTGRRLIWGKGMNVGQTCVAPDHILVSKANESKLIESLKQALREFYPTTSISSTNGRQFSKLVNESQSNRLDKLLRETGGEIVQTGGDFPLTIVRQVTGEDVLMKDEIFGPVLPILTYDSVADVLPSIADAEPLALYVFTASDKNFEMSKPPSHLPAAYIHLISFPCSSQGTYQVGTNSSKRPVSSSHNPGSTIRRRRQISS